MSLIGFECSYKGRVPLDCYKTCDKLCMTKPMLRYFGVERPFELGNYSVTQLINGTRENYLKATKPYYVDPKSSIYALLGTNIHHALERCCNGEIMEVRSSSGYVNGAFDLLDDGVLYDYKTYGSYKVACTLGLKSKVTYVGGKRKYNTYKSVRKNIEAVMQMNMYRLLIEGEGDKWKEEPIKIKKMVLAMIPKDATSEVARNYGLGENYYESEIRRVSDIWVRRYFKKKSKLLTQAITEEKCPPKCSHRECWGGRKCTGYCVVKDYCKVEGD